MVSVEVANVIVATGVLVGFVFGAAAVLFWQGVATVLVKRSSQDIGEKFSND